MLVAAAQQSVLAGAPWTGRPPSVVVCGVPATDRPEVGLLAARLLADLVADGVAGPQMALRLAISPRTVQTHVSNALRKLGLHTRVELAAAATRHRDT